jgi:hypothetical protein
MSAAAMATIANDPAAAHLDDIDPTQDPTQLTDLIPLRAVTLPSGRGRKRIHIATVYRWTSEGCRGVRLRYMQVGATRCTTRAWLDEFFAALTALSDGTGTPQPAPYHTAPLGARSPAARRKAVERADAALTAMGV